MLGVLQVSFYFGLGVVLRLSLYKVTRQVPSRVRGRALRWKRILRSELDVGAKLSDGVREVKDVKSAFGILGK